MTGRIITVRHGRPDLSRDLKITAAEFGDWWTRYDRAGLHPDERSPQGLIDLASEARTVLSSTLPRSIETARQATGGKRDVPADPIFVEAPLPPPPAPSFLKLHPAAWGVISRTFWFLGYAPGDIEAHVDTWDRVRNITARLSRHAHDGDVMLCAHGYLNWMIDRRLRREGWLQTSRAGGNRYWSWRIYEAPGAPQKAASVEAA